MGYFSNGNEGIMYQTRYCDRCLNYRDLEDGRGPGCPIWDLHLMHNYQRERAEPLHWFIPFEDGQNGECKMFLKNAFANGVD